MAPTLRPDRRTRRLLALAAVCVIAGSLGAIAAREAARARRLRVVAPGRLLGGAWQTPDVLIDLIRREHIRTVVTLTAINRDDRKYVGQSDAVRRTGVDWIIVPMRGSTATLDQMADAADLLADRARQPVYFHCVGGHHRTSLAHAAYLIRHAGYSAETAWAVVAGFPWARPGAPADENDRALIREFARVQASIPPNPHAGEPQDIHGVSP